jgi:hypothetical protein
VHDVPPELDDEELDEDDELPSLPPSLPPELDDEELDDEELDDDPPELDAPDDPPEEPGFGTETLSPVGSVGVVVCSPSVSPSAGSPPFAHAISPATTIDEQKRKKRKWGRASIGGFLTRTLRVTSSANRGDARETKPPSEEKNRKSERSRGSVVPSSQSICERSWRVAKPRPLRGVAKTTPSAPDLLTALLSYLEAHATTGASGAKLGPVPRSGRT